MTPGGEGVVTLAPMERIRAVAWRLRSGVASYLGLLDVAIAVALAAGSLTALSHLHYRGSAELAATSCVVAAAAVGLRRTVPHAAQVLAVTAVMVYQSVTRDPQGAFVSATLALVGYWFGRSTVRTVRYRQAVAILGYCLAVLEIGLYPSHQSTPVGTLGTWLTIVLVPAVVGAAVERRDQLARQLAEAAKELRDEQLLRIERAAAEERNRVARELHDVVAHHLSVMAIHAGAARTLADRPDAAPALRTVAEAATEALAELRHIAGVLRRRDGPWDGHPPRMDQLDAVVARTRAAGVAVQMQISGDLDAVPPGVDLAAYRIVQEALTNVVKHAASTTASVAIEVSGEVLSLSVTNDGDRGVPAQLFPRSGQGLIGMQERVALYDGHMSADHRPGGGFVVRAAIPLRPTARTRPMAPLGRRPVPVAARRLAWPALRRHTDGTLAAFWFVALETEALTSSLRRGSLALNMGVVGAMTILGVCRRRWPLPFLIAVALLALPLDSGLTTLRTSTITGTYVLLVPITTVAVSTGWAQAVTGLVIMEAAVVAAGALTHAPLAGVAGAGLMAGVVWVAARVWRSYRQIHRELTATISQLEAEGSEREQLARMNQRALIAQDLNRLVASQVTAVIVGARAALSDGRPESLGAAAAVIEDTVRQALGRMRDLLGVLRVHATPTEPCPQPGSHGRGADMARTLRLACLGEDQQ